MYTIQREKIQYKKAPGKAG